MSTKDIILRAEQSRAEQSRAEQSRAEQSRAEQSRAWHSIVCALILLHKKAVETVKFISQGQLPFWREK